MLSFFYTIFLDIKAYMIFLSSLINQFLMNEKILNWISERTEPKKNEIEVQKLSDFREVFTLSPNNINNKKIVESLSLMIFSQKSVEKNIFIIPLRGTRRFTDILALPNKKDVEAIKHQQSEISPYSGCNIQFTSGTTGRAKATLLAHRSMVNNSFQVIYQSWRQYFYTFQKRM